MEKLPSCAGERNVGLGSLTELDAGTVLELNHVDKGLGEAEVVPDWVVTAAVRVGFDEDKLACTAEAHALGHTEATGGAEAFGVTFTAEGAAGHDDAGLTYYVEGLVGAPEKVLGDDAGTFVEGGVALVGITVAAAREAGDKHAPVVEVTVLVREVTCNGGAVVVEGGVAVDLKVVSDVQATAVLCSGTAVEVGELGEGGFAAVDEAGVGAVDVEAVGAEDAVVVHATVVGEVVLDVEGTTVDQLVALVVHGDVTATVEDTAFFDVDLEVAVDVGVLVPVERTFDDEGTAIVGVDAAGHGDAWADDEGAGAVVVDRTDVGVAVDTDDVGGVVDVDATACNGLGAGDARSCWAALALVGRIGGFLWLILWAGCPAPRLEEWGRCCVCATAVVVCVVTPEHAAGPWVGPTKE